MVIENSRHWAFIYHNFQVLIFVDRIDLFCDIEDAVGVELSVESGNSVEHIEH